MAIGSAPEVGVQFRSFGELKTEDERRGWYEQVRRFGDDGMAGYGTLGFVARYVGAVPPLAVGLDRRT